MSSSTARPKIPLLISLTDLVRMLPVNKQTVYRWRVASKEGESRPVLPEPDLIVARSPENPAKFTPLWFEESIQAFLEPLGYTLDAEELDKLREDQGASRN